MDWITKFIFSESVRQQMQSARLFVVMYYDPVLVAIAIKKERKRIENCNNF